MSEQVTARDPPRHRRATHSRVITCDVTPRPARIRLAVSRPGPARIHIVPGKADRRWSLSPTAAADRALAGFGGAKRR